MTEPSFYHVTFLRHGESVGNAQERFQGHADYSLTGKGRAQARALADRWQVEGVTARPQKLSVRHLTFPWNWIPIGWKLTMASSVV